MERKKIKNNDLLSLVSCQTPAKTTFIADISRNLAANETLFLTDYISQLPFSLSDETLGYYTITKAEWANLLAEHQLQLVRYIDASAEIIHFLDDPESATAMLPSIAPYVTADFNCHYNLKKLLQRKLISFALFTIKKCNDLSIEKLKRLNVTVLDLPLSYLEATQTENWFYTVNWENLLETPISNYTTTQEIWLIVAKFEHKLLIELLQTRLKLYASRIIVCYTKDNFSRESFDKGEDILYFNPEQLQHWLQCFKAIRKLNVRHILYLPALNKAETKPESENFLKNIQQQHLQLTYFCQAFNKANLYTVPKVWLITADVSKTSALPGFNHSLLSSQLGNWLAENPSRSCTALDLDPSFDDQSMVEALIHILVNGTTESQVVLHSAGYKVPRFNRLTLPLANPLADKALHFKNNASCLIANSEYMLITGIVAWLIKQNVTHFLLIDQQPSNLLTQAIIDELSGNGITIATAQIDLAKADQLATVLEEAAGNLPPIHYVIYNAQELNADLEKIPEIIHLHQLTQALPLDYFITFAPFNAQLATSENAWISAFLHTLADHRQQLGLPALNIHWSAWSANINPEALLQQLLLGFYPIDNSQICTTLAQALHLSQANLSIALVPAWMPGSRLQGCKAFTSCEQLHQLLTSKITASNDQRASRGNDFQAGFLQHEALVDPLKRLPAIEHMIIQLMQAVANDTHDHLLSDASSSLVVNFSELGFDAIMLLDLHQRIQKELGDSLLIPKDILSSYPSISELTRYLDRKIPVTTVIGISDSKKAASLQAPNARKDIAIIGISGRFPGANNINEFWGNLRDGKSSITEIPKERWSIADFYDPDPGNLTKSNSKWGGFLTNIDQFDAHFFQITPLEATSMDPQQRLFLEEAWRAFEAAGYSDVTLEKINCGVYVGLGLNNEYQELINCTTDNDLYKYQFTGNHSSILAARIAYHLNLKGPALSFDTGCSSSLVAIHLACQALQNPEVDMMLAGGITLLLTEKPFIMTSNAGILSSDGKCKTFDDAANGIAISEGVGVAILKRLEDAIADRDPIFGIIKASGINQDGKTSGITVPSTEAQHELHTAIYQAAGIDPHSISYFEAHGTGTKLGDPIEFRALQQTFASDNEKQFCALGSAKTNIGHTAAAAGIAGLTKVLLCMQHKTLVPSLNFNNPNQHIDFKNSAFFVNTELRSWQTKSSIPRRAAVNSFSINGTNAHVVVEEAPPLRNSYPIIKPYYLIALSAKTQTALRQKIKDLMHWCADTTAALVETSYTLLVGRSHFKWRCGWVVNSLDELQAKLAQVIAENFSISENYLEKEINQIPPHLEEQLAEIIQTALTDSQQDEKYYNHLTRLLSLYLQGGNGNWEFLFDAEMPQRISLPTYPFDPHHYWIPKNSQLELPLSSKNPDARNNTMNIQRQETLLAEVKKLLADLIRIEEGQLNTDTPFLEMGADSIVLLSAIHQIEDKYKIKISVQQLFEQCNTLHLLSKYLDENLPEVAANTQPLPLKSIASCDLDPGIHARTTQTMPEHPASIITINTPHHTQATQTVQVPQSQLTIPVIQQAPAPSAVQAITTSTLPQNALEQLISQQLAIMTQQLQLLQGLPLTPTLLPQGDRGSYGSSLSQGSIVSTSQFSGSTVNSCVTGNHLAPKPATVSALITNPVTPQTPVTPQATTSQITSWQHRKVETNAGNLNLRQQQHIQALTTRFCARTKLSKQYAQKYRTWLADSKASVGFRMSIKEMLYPIVGKRTQGARLWDIDGNEYIDITMGFGVHLFGYQPDFLMQAMQAQVQQGIQIGPRSPLVGEVAQLFTELTGMERVAFANSGTEAVMTALRLARAKTGKTRYVIFKNSYHGHADFSLVEAQIRHADGTASPLTPGIPKSALSEAIVLDYGDMSALSQIQQHGTELAAVIVEPIQSRNPALQPKAFLQQLRDITKQFGIVLIFDEMLTAFRLHIGGAQAFFDVRADLATYGKIVGGGMPIGIVAGSSELMDSVDGGFWQYGDNSYPETERTFFGGTFCQHAFTLATAHAVLTQLKQEGPQLQQQLNQKTANLAQELNQFFEEQQAPIRVVYWGSLFKFDFTQNLDLLFYHLLEKGIYVWEWRNCFLSTAHTDSDIARIIQAVKESIFELQKGGFLPEPPNGTGGDDNNTGRSNNINSAANPPACALNYWDRHTSKPSLMNRNTCKNDQAVTRTFSSSSPASLDFSVSYFGHYDAQYHPEKYELILQSIKYADAHGFKAAWVPERHFHPFGGFSPNPSVLCAALARETTQIALRAGSVVLPLHHPVRIAEEWAVVDNLSNGRIGIAFASGWHPQDFIFQPQAYGQHRTQTFEQIASIQQLWRGETLHLPGGDGNPVAVKLFPMPKQAELPIWMTIVNNPDTYIKAGEIGAGILTNLMGQTIADLSHNIALYRQALVANGFSSEQGRVTVLLHTYLNEDLETAHNIARQPFCNYLKTTLSLLKNLMKMQGLHVDVDNLNAQDLEYLLNKVYQGYVESSALIGTVDSCIPVIDHLIKAGVNEIGCFIDFGIEREMVLNSLPLLTQLKDRYCSAVVKAPLSKAQQQLYTLSQLGENNAGSLTYHIFVDVELKGDLNIPVLQDAIQQIIARHEALRTTIDRKGNQSIQSDLKIEIPIIDFSNEDSHNQQAKIAEFLAKDQQQCFDLARGPLLRVHLLKIAAQHHLLSIVTHHIVMDGHSMGIFLDELRHIYNATCQNTTAQLTTPLAFRDYLLTINPLKHRYNQGYWQERIKGIPTFIDLPANLPRPAYRIHKAGSKNRSLSVSLTQALKKLASQQGCTPFMLMISAYSAFLARITQQYQFILSVPNHGRDAKAANNMLGYTANLLPLTFQINDELAFNAYLKTVKADLLEAYAHQDFLFAELIESFPNDPSLFPLGNVHFNMERVLSAQENSSQKHLTLNWLWLPRSPAFIDKDLFFNIYEMENSFTLSCDYSSELFYPETIDSMLAAFEVFLESITFNSEQAIKNIPLVNTKTADILLNQYNPPKNSVPIHQSLPAIFETHVTNNSQAIALSDGKRQLSYQQLNETANQLARYICEFVRNHYESAPEELFIGIYMHGSIEAIISMLAIVKTGYAYVPLDPANPEERIHFILDNAKIKLILAVDCLKSKISATVTDQYQVLYVDADREKFSTYSTENLEQKVNANQLAYVIYTSGSTGNPKGVMIEHASVIRLVVNTNYVSINPTDKMAQILNIAFDGSIFEIWGSLLNGAELVISDFARELNVEKFSDFVEKNKITVIQITAALIEFCLMQKADIFNHIPYLLFVGDVIKPEVMNLLPKDPLQRPHFVINGYGPTENAVFTTTYAIPEVINTPSIPIGKPINHTTAYILDQNLQLLPPGMIGELYTGGTGLARGYLNNPSLTAEKFIPNPYGSGRLYKTGDLARWLPDGNIEFLGRIDTQVKVNGFRIELEEIEKALLKHPAILQAAVIAAECNHSKILAAFYAPKNQSMEIANDITADILHAHLNQLLPAYMLPSKFIKLNQLPLTPNGKLDRRYLQRQLTVNTDTSAITHTVDAELEYKLLNLWQSVLGNHITPSNYDSFFISGGNSLLAAKLLHAINQHFHLDLPLSFIFSHTSIAQQAQQIRSLQLENNAKQACLSFNTQGTQPPLFFIHPAQVGAEAYYQMGKLLNPDQPFYALDSYNLQQQVDYLDSIEKMAKHYQQIIRNIQPKGPYYLGGWSLGGLVAYEIAAQLTALGEEVDALYLIDSFLIDQQFQKANDPYQVFMDFHSMNNQLLSLPPALQEKADKVLRIEIAAVINYWPQHRFNGNIHLFKAKKICQTADSLPSCIEELHRDQHNGWDKLLDTIQIHHLEGDHQTIMQGECLKYMVDVITNEVTIQALQ